MIKNKRLSSMFVFLAACSLMATGFTSQAASLQSETNHTTGIETADIQTTAMQTISEEFVASASEVTAEGQQMAAEETARREQEAKGGEFHGRKVTGIIQSSCEGWDDHK